MQAIADSAGEDYDLVNPDASGQYWWTASHLTFCPRAEVLTRAGLAIDPRPTKGRLTTRLGTIVHKEVERGIRWLCAKDPTLTVVTMEQRFFHEGRTLTAKPDGILHKEGVGLVIYDFKTEHENAARHRAKQAKDNDAISNAKPEHAIQLAAGAECAESNGIGPIVQGACIYMSKNNMWTEMPAVDLEDPYLRREVWRLVDGMDAAWAAWKDAEVNRTPVVLPRRLSLPDDSWKCREEKNGQGTYCQARSTCFHERMPG